MGNFEELYETLRKIKKYVPEGLYDEVFDVAVKVEQRVEDDAVMISEIAIEDTLNYANGVSEDEVIAMLKELGELNGGS